MSNEVLLGMFTMGIWWKVVAVWSLGCIRPLCVPSRIDSIGIPVRGRIGWAVICGTTTTTTYNTRGSKWVRRMEQQQAQEPVQYVSAMANSRNYR